MPSDYYSDSEEGGSMAESAPTKETTSAEDKPTFLVPKSAFGGRDVAPDDIEKIKVVRVMDDQVEAVCIYGEEEEETGDSEGEAAMPAGGGMKDQEMEELMS